MRVQEKGSNRKAHAHLYALGQMDALAEYGEYVDPVDKAICCFVPVKKDMVLKLGGKFTGTTLIIAYDATVDGILRKANSYNGKLVSLQKSKPLDFDKFLFQTGDDIRDTDIKVASISGDDKTGGNKSRNIGTIELRVFALRAFGEEHSIGDIKTYYNAAEDAPGTCEAVASHNMITPDFKMNFEENSSALDKRDAMRLRRKVDAKRPGKGPWAIFRFHYRSQDSIDEKTMEKTHDPKTKLEHELHSFELEPVPALQAGARPAKGDDVDTSTRASSPHSAPSTPTLSKFLKKLPPKFTPSVPASLVEDQHRSSGENHEGHQGVANKETDDETDPATLGFPLQNFGIPPQSSDTSKKLGKDHGAKIVPTTNDKGSPTQEVIEQSVESASTPAHAKPVESATPTAKILRSIATAVVIPAKRPSKPVARAPPELKRTRFEIASTSPQPPQTPSDTSITSQEPASSLTDMRKQLQTAKKKRELLAAKRAKVDREMEKYQVQIDAEKERIQKELEEEQRAFSAEMVGLQEDEAMLAEFKTTEDEE